MCKDESQNDGLDVEVVVQEMPAGGILGISIQRKGAHVEVTQVLDPGKPYGFRVGDRVRRVAGAEVDSARDVVDAWRTARDMCDFSSGACVRLDLVRPLDLLLGSEEWSDGHVDDAFSPIDIELDGLDFGLELEPQSRTNIVVSDCPL